MGCRGGGVTEGVFEERIFAAYAVEKILAHNSTGTAAAPLFLVYASHAAHSPLQAPSDTLARFAFISNHSDKPEHTRQVYTAMVAEADAAIGSLVDALEAKAMWGDTLLVYVSDNGGPSYLNGTSGANNYPLTGGKMSNYEGGIRVGSFVSGGFVPRSRRGAKYTRLVAIWDWYATLASLAGVAGKAGEAGGADEAAGLPGVDAIDVSRSLLYGEEDAPTRTQLCIGTANRSQRLVDGVFLDVALGVGQAADAPTRLHTRGPRPRRALFKLLVGMQNQAARASPLSPNGTMDASLTFPAPGKAWVPDAFAHDCGDAGCLYEVLSDPSEAFDYLAQGSIPSPVAAVLRRMRGMLDDCRSTSFMRVVGVPDEAACAAAASRGNHWGPWV